MATNIKAIVPPFNKGQRETAWAGRRSLTQLTCLLPRNSRQSGLLFKLHSKHRLNFISPGKHTLVMQTGHGQPPLRCLLPPAKHFPAPASDLRDRCLDDETIGHSRLVPAAHQLVTKRRLVRRAYAQPRSQAMASIDVHQHTGFQWPPGRGGWMDRRLGRVGGHCWTRWTTVWTVFCIIFFFFEEGLFGK